MAGFRVPGACLSAACCFWAVRVSAELVSAELSVVLVSVEPVSARSWSGVCSPGAAASLLAAPSVGVAWRAGGGAVVRPAGRAAASGRACSGSAA
ncbi:hypothetical protein GCM10010411_84580 [Actinomadura fulvescens]|uniref:Secreted protein n=1 Tax=Actinomadura fulvescens TaxID=46160 RepID=A0ABN3QRA0_9ACTN